MPKVSVIVPNYNHERFLKLRMDSILNQTFQDFEIIILDDCSTDNSKSIIEQYCTDPKVSHIVYNGKNSGSTFKQWERGMQLATGDWLWIAESDDYADCRFLEVLVNLLPRHHNVGIAYCNSYQVDDNNQTERDIAKYMDCDFKNGIVEVKERLCQFNTITNVSSCLLKRDIALKAIDGLGKYKACGDWIFYTRVLQQANLAHTCEKLNYYRWHPNNVSYTASTNGLYITEGIDVIKNIDFNIVKFSLKEYLSLSKGWINKILKIGFKEGLKPAMIMILVTSKFCITKLGINITL